MLAAIQPFHLVSKKVKSNIYENIILPFVFILCYSKGNTWIEGTEENI
jgi:hypothetical protein